MRDTMRILTGFVLFAAIFVAGLFLITSGMISSLTYYILLALSLIVLVLSFVLMKGEWVSFDGETVRIEAPFAKFTIPRDSIQAIDLERDFKMGLRVFGYGGISRGSGNFSNSTLGDYILAGSSKFPMIIVRYVDKGKEQYAAFNLPSESATLELYGRLTSDNIQTGIDAVDTPNRYRKKRRNLVIAVAAIIAISVCVSAIALSIGSATAYVEDDELIIDGTMFHRSITLEDIESVEMRENMDYGSRIAGLGNHKALTGHFRNSEFGDYELCVNRAVKECIVIDTISGIYAFNLQTSDETIDLFDMLNQMIEGNPGGNAGA